MSRTGKGKGIGLIVGGLVCWAGAIAVGVFAVLAMLKSFAMLDTLQGPGKTTLSVAEAGVVTVWHDHRTLYEGRTVNHPEDLPGGYSFVMRDASGAELPMNRGMSMTMESGATERVAVGTFELPAPGDYELVISGPPAEPRVFSVGEGTVMGGLGPFFGGFFGAMLLGLAGLGLIIGGIIVLVVARRPALPLPPGAPPAR